MAVVTRRNLMIVASALAIALVAGALGFWLWLSSYAPLEYGSMYGPGPRSVDRIVSVEPAFGSNGKTVLFPRVGRTGTIDVGFSVRNGGRFDVELVGAVAGSFNFMPVRLQTEPGCLHVSGSCAYESLVPVDRHHPLEIASKDERLLLVTYRVGICPQGQPRDLVKGGNGAGSGGSIKLRFRVHGLERTQWLELPFALTLVCAGEMHSLDSG